MGRDGLNEVDQLTFQIWIPFWITHHIMSFSIPNTFYINSFFISTSKNGMIKSISKFANFLKSFFCVADWLFRMCCSLVRTVSDCHCGNRIFRQFEYSKVVIKIWVIILKSFILNIYLNGKNNHTSVFLIKYIFEWKE